MTLEEAQQRIIELTEEVQTLTGERDAAQQTAQQLTAETEELRTLNQRYFNKLIAQDKLTANIANNEDKEEPVPPSCEEFAKTLKL